MSTSSFLRYNIVTTLRCNLKCKYCLAGCDTNLTWESDPIKTVVWKYNKQILGGLNYEREY